MCNSTTDTVNAPPPPSACTAPTLCLLIVLVLSWTARALFKIICFIFSLKLSHEDHTLACQNIAHSGTWQVFHLQLQRVLQTLVLQTHCKSHTRESLPRGRSRLIQQSPKTGCYQVRNFDKIYSANRYTSNFNKLRD